MKLNNLMGENIMKNRITIFLVLILFFIGVSNNNAQVDVTLNIENQNAVGTDFFFDLYLVAPNDVLYLGGSDFVLTFNSAAFTNPVLSREAPGFWSLTSSDASSVGSSYRSSTATAAISSDELIINLNQVAFGDQFDFNSNVAKIDNVTNTHQLGRYKVSGISNTSATMNLQWKTSGGGVVTQVFTLAPTDPWAASPVNLINAVNPNDAPLPVELTSFSATNQKGNVVNLQWETATEVNNYGFEVERSIKVEDNEVAEWNKISFIEGAGNSNSQKLYSFVDKNPVGGTKFAYRLKQIDIDGTFEYSDLVEIEVLPTEYELYQNYPNPFNPSTKIKFSLPEDAKVAVDIYNMLGQRVMTLFNKDMKAGYHQVLFDTQSAGNQLASGVYLYTISTKNFSSVKKMVLLK